MAGAIYQFGDFQLDCGRFELLLNGRSLRVERKPMELLILLASRQGQLVSRAEIALRLWSHKPDLYLRAVAHDRYWDGSWRAHIEGRMAEKTGAMPQAGL